MDNWGDSGGFGSFGQKEPSRREKLEIDYDGKTTAEKNKLKEEKYKQDMEAMKNGNYGNYGNSKPSFKDKFRNKGYGNRNTYSEGTWWHFLLAIGIIVGIIYLVYASMTTGLDGVWRTFNASPTENFATFKNSLVKLEQDQKDLDKTEEQLAQDEVYKKNKIFRGETLREQPYPEYIVYVYTETEADAPFNKYVNKVESGEIELSIPIYKIYYNEVDDMDVNSALKTGDPGFVFFKEPIDGTKLFDSVLTDAKLFDKIAEYADGLVAERDENLKNNNR